MGLKEFFFRGYVLLSGYKPKIFTPEEKAAMIPRMIEANRKQDRDLAHCDPAFRKGLSYEEIPLPHCGAWFIHAEGNPTDRILYYIHGGGFTGACTLKRMRFVSYLVTKFHYNVFSIDYRLAPEFKQPSALEDCLDGYRYLLSRVESRHIVVLGESAGGTLSLVLALALRERKLPLPSGVYSNSAVTQFVKETDSYRRYSLKKDFIVVSGILENTEGIYFDKKDAMNPYVSPLYGDLSNLPPIALSASGCECLLDDSKMLFDALKAAGNESQLFVYPGLCHAFIMSPQLGGVVRKSYPDFERFLKARLA